MKGVESKRPSKFRPYYIAPEGKVGVDAFAVIRDVIEAMDRVALGRVVLTSREHVIALEPRGKGLMGTLLRYPYEVRDESEYFDDIPAGHVTKDMLELAKHIVQTKSGHFQPEKFEDHYEPALKELLKKKQAGQTITPAKEARPTNVVNLMDALRKSVQAEGGTARATTKRAAAGRKSSSKKGRKHEAEEGRMSFSSPPPTKHSRYFDNGSPKRCYHCGQGFRGCAIRDSETNCYFCCDSCLEAAQFIRFTSLPRKAS